MKRLLEAKSKTCDSCARYAHSARLLLWHASQKGAQADEAGVLEAFETLVDELVHPNQTPAMRVGGVHSNVRAQFGR
jgi:hypothetical protein